MTPVWRRGLITWRLATRTLWNPFPRTNSGPGVIATRRICAGWWATIPPSRLASSLRPWPMPAANATGATIFCPPWTALGFITREELEDIERRLDKFVGDDTKEENLKFLSELFDSKTQSTISWKCNLIKLLRIGIAPKVDIAKFVHENIPTGKVNIYLKELVERGIVYKEEIDSFYINENYEWMYSYIDKPVWLKEEFERRDLEAVKEKEYQTWLKNNLEKVESGLLKEQKESRMETGTIDFLCRDKEGKLVGLELKYPKASKANAKQLIAYATEQRKMAGGENFRGIMIAPTIPDSLKELLSDHKLEYKEIDSS